MASWRRCDNCRRVLSIDDFPSADASATTCTSCLTPKRRTRRASPVTTSGSARATRNGAPSRPVDPATLIGRGDPAARRARARARALEQLTTAHAEQFADLLARASAERRGPGRARSELAELHAEEYRELLVEAERAEGLPASFGS